jgi:hypothetical protein
MLIAPGKLGFVLDTLAGFYIFDPMSLKYGAVFSRVLATVQF